MSPHHEFLRTKIVDCPDVSELLDIAETCIRTSRLLGNADPREADEYQVHARQALSRAAAVRAAERASA